jgi:putative ABC transport system permease protein
MFDDVKRDVSYALRSLARNPRFTLVALLTLALGIGANTAIFSVLDAVMLRPLPYEKPSELVAFAPQRYDAFRTWTENLRSLETAGAYTYSLANVNGGVEPVRVWSLAVTSSLLPTLGVSPLLGRAFTPEDDLPQPRLRVMLCHAFWKTQFGGDPNLIGRTINLSGQAYEVIGILPAALEFPPPARSADGSMPRTPEVWIGAGTLPDLRERGGFYAIGRLTRGSSAEAAAAELNAVANASAGTSREPLRVQVKRVDESVIAPLRPAILAFTAGVALVLLVACANLGSLLLVRLTSRQRELAVRISLGASPSRIARQILTEGAVLAMGGALAGISVASLLLRTLLALAPAELARVQDATLNARVLSITLALAIVTALLIGVAPAWRALVRDPRDDLGSTRGASSDRRTGRVQAALVVCEIAFAVILLVGGGLLLRSFAALAGVNPGFRSGGLVTADVLVPPDRYASRESVLQFFDRLEERAGASPGMRSVSAIDRLPYGPSWSRISFRIAGRPADPAASAPACLNTAARPGYFKTMGIPIVAGREFTVADSTGSRPVVVISRTLAERYWPGQSSIGERISVFKVEREIVGVADDVRHLGPATPVDPIVYLPQAQDITTRRMMSVVARTDGSADAALTAVRGAIRSIDPELPISNLRSFDALRSERTASQRFNALLVASFAALALVLALVGLYGVMSFVVAQRTHEIGLRMALGAQRSAVLTLVLRQSMVLILLGTVLGVGTAAAVTRYLGAMLFGLTPLDPATFVGACVMFAIVAMLSAYLPARRAAKVDPLIALRWE